MLSILYDFVPNVPSELIRTAYIPALDLIIVVNDFSAIEARVLAYLAGEQRVLDVFHNGGDIYCETAIPACLFHTYKYTGKFASLQM